jgi:hypothetical protein
LLYLKLAEPLAVDGSQPLAVRVAGLLPGDTVEVRYGPDGAEQLWHPRSGPLSWLRATATPGEILLQPGQIPTQVTFLATMAGHRAVGATVHQLSGARQSWAHPGATPREGQRWSFLAITPGEAGKVLLIARDESATAQRRDGGIPEVAALAAVIDVSASMAPSVQDGRLATALAAVQAAAARSRLSAVTVTFVAGDWASRKTLSVQEPTADTIRAVTQEAGWRTGTVSDLLAATDVGDAVWVVSDAPLPLPAGRRMGLVLTAPATSDGAGDAVHLRAGESITELADRLVGAVAASR